MQLDVDLITFVTLRARIRKHTFVTIILSLGSIVCAQANAGFVCLNCLSEFISCNVEKREKP
jgi:hypothetical protein